jgi:hypothetical protein
VREFGNGYSRPNLFRMIRFAEVFPDEQIVSTLSRQLGWSHFVEIIPLEDDFKRDFYSEMCRIERWSVRTLRQKIGGMLFEKSGIRVTSYWTKVLPRDLLQKKLHEAIQHARDRLAQVERLNEKKLLPE